MDFTLPFHYTNDRKYILIDKMILSSR